jgi:ATP-dependent protease ClpP protease subunit
MKTTLFILLSLFVTVSNANKFDDVYNKYLDSFPEDTIITKIYDNELKREVPAIVLGKSIHLMRQQPAYNDVIKTLADKRHGVVYIFIVNNIGGYTLTINQFREAIQKGGNKIKIAVFGYAVSAAANLTCLGHSFYFDKDAIIAIHIGSILKPKNMTKADELLLKANMRLYIKETKHYWENQCMPKGLLTQEEIDDAYNTGVKLGPTDEKPLTAITSDEIKKRISPKLKDPLW